MATITVLDSVGATQTVAKVTATGALAGSGSLPTVAGQKTSTDKSGTITLGGTAQNAIASNANRLGWSLTNLSSEAMYVTDTGTAATTSTGVYVGPNQTVSDGGFHLSTSAISVIAATTGDVFAAQEYT